ncbi:MAG: polyphosphate polymerase domain-containing protein [Anaerolineae bacterium]|nr:polyphosphate polymerase domain-containing protein [Anaerolineae bacterium]
MNNIGSIIRKFNRFELKYVLPLEAAHAFKQELARYLQPDNYGDGVGNYAITNLYFDSPDYHFYWEKVNGIRFRRKLRIRHYETQQTLAPEDNVFVEIKQRVDRVTQKRRVRLPYRDALRLCNDRVIPGHHPQDWQVIEEIHAMSWQYNLQPTSVVSYFRQAYVGTDYDVGLRVTFDTNLRYRAHSLQLDAKQPGKFMAPPDLVVMEIKVNERIPYWLTELVARHNFRLARISKYCLSVEASDRVPPARFHIV